MLKQMTTLALVTSLVGCAATQDPKQPAPVDVDTFNASLSEQKSELVTLISTSQSEQQAALTSLSAQLEQLSKQVAAVKTQPEKQVVQVPVQCDPSPIGDKFILGAVEHVYVDEIKAGFETRIDTGAESSSLDAHNIILFERNGKQWVRFDVFTQGADKPSQTFESKVERFVRIKQDADDKNDRRPVIHAHLQIGNYKAETDLNLVDRSHLDYQLLLGRKFMQDIAVVDVGQTFVHGKNNPSKTAK
ncbi:RimK/LysX family protein [Shewanella alkalitolerans]|uniref:ATP-dependent zinc protease family protein n=1 Tax=Shewanella alkalitolerans TaxID=2864209 RepID=UPI001C65CF44|nr:RimK/LysX family protein [Shewanella alkalitolerans]QYJ96035.1 RimK/LysX family protein [Shewanella alkalitolerans]